MFRRISRLAVNGCPSSKAMARMLCPVCRRSAIVILSASDRNRAEIAAGLWMEMGGIPLTFPDFGTTV